MHIVNRVTLPTQYSYEPYGTQWRYSGTDGTEICYVQMGRDEANPHWIKFGSLLEFVFYDRLEEPEFMNKIMESYAIKE